MPIERKHDDGHRDDGRQRRRPRHVARSPRDRTQSLVAGFRRNQRGAILIVALLLAALIAVGLGSYINLNLSSSRLAKRTFNGYAALNLAEAGAEEAVWSFNRTQRGDTEAWSKWTNNGSAAWQKFSDFSFGANTTGSVKVYVDTFRPSTNSRPKIVAQSSIAAPGETPVTRMLEVTLRRRSLFANGLVAKDTVSFAGAVASVDSWNSDPDNNDATAAVPYSSAVRTDHGTVASTAVVNSAVLVNQANIWGYVATGGGQPDVGTNGTIRGVSTPSGVKIDPSRISTDFNADFDLVLVPVDGTVLTTVGATLGTLGTKTKWRIPSIALTGTQTLTILGDVTIVLTATTGNALDVGGTAQIIVPAGSKLTIYVETHLKIAGKGLANGNIQPASCQIYGVSNSPGGQDLEIVGNGSLCAVVYAPNGNVEIKGNGDVMGSIVANKIKIAGNADFHYDESLADRDSSQPFSISKWRELTSASDRARYEALFQGW